MYKHLYQYYLVRLVPPHHASCFSTFCAPACQVGAATLDQPPESLAGAEY